MNNLKLLGVVLAKIVTAVSFPASSILNFPFVLQLKKIELQRKKNNNYILLIISNKYLSTFYNTWSLSVSEVCGAVTTTIFSELLKIL